MARQDSSEGTPAITFEAQPAMLASGGSATLSWKTSNASSVSISGLGGVPVSGSVKVTPAVTTTYTATAIGPGGKSESSAVVRVFHSGPKPTIHFMAQPGSMSLGTATTLGWTTTNATSVSIAGVGKFGATGSTEVTPRSTTTYTATATGPGGTSVSSITVTVTTSGPTPMISFNAQPNEIAAGVPAVLSWNASNATSVSISGLGNFPGKGWTTVTPGTSTVYTATAQGPGGTAQASTTVTVEPNAIPLSHLQATGGWQSWGELPPNYSICAYPCSGITWAMKQGIKTPSLSGNATQFNIGGTAPYADVLWSNPLIGQGSTQGLPDANHTLLPTLHNFSYDAYFYPTNLGAAQALEFDISMYFDGLGLIWGNQCNLAGGDVWDIWDNVNQQWVSTGVPCPLNNNAWNHATIQVQRESDNWLLFQSVTLNGVTANINQYYAPGSAPDNWWGITVNYQMDGNYQQEAYDVFLDNFIFTAW